MSRILFLNVFSCNISLIFMLRMSEQRSQIKLPTFTQQSDCDWQVGTGGYIVSTQMAPGVTEETHTNLGRGACFLACETWHMARFADCCDTMTNQIFVLGYLFKDGVSGTGPGRAAVEWGDKKTANLPDGCGVLGDSCSCRCLYQSTANLGVDWPSTGSSTAGVSDADSLLHTHFVGPTHYGTTTAGTCAQSGGDPHVTNLAGESFDILQTGKISLISISDKSEKNLLEVNGHITATGEACGESYIKNLTITGSWLQKLQYNILNVRGNVETLQVADDEDWKDLKAVNTGGINSAHDGKVLMLHIEDITLQIDMENYYEKTASNWQDHTQKLGWSFLNVRILGVNNHKGSLNIGGVLGFGNHTEAAQTPADCKQFFADNAPRKPSGCRSTLTASHNRYNQKMF